MAEQPTISTHVLDAENGQPMAGVEVELKRSDGGLWLVVGRGTTDEDGRIRRLITDPLIEGMYRLEFQLGGRFFEEVALTIRVSDVSRSYHVPLLVTPWSYSTYRGS